MQRYILGRALQAVFCLWAILTVVFFLSRLSGDPTYLLLGLEHTSAEYERMRVHLGLDQPLYVQYGLYISDMVRGDFGQSIHMRRPVVEILLARYPATLQIGALALVWSVLSGLFLGVYAAVKRGTRFDLAARFVAVFGQSVPNFWLGLMLILVFGLWLDILPPGGRAGPESMILPSITLGVLMLAGLTRITRSSMLDVLDSEYIRLARIKGVSERMVIWKHALKNAMLPVITFASVWYVTLLAGSVVTETVFAWPGIGQLAIQSIIWRDFPVTQAIVLIFAALYIIGGLIVDIIYAYINPRIRYGHGQ